MKLAPQDIKISYVIGLRKRSMVKTLWKIIVDNPDELALGIGTSIPGARSPRYKKNLRKNVA